MLAENEQGEMIVCPRCDAANQAGSFNCQQCGYYFSTRPFPDSDYARPTFPVPSRILLSDSSGEGDEAAPDLTFPPRFDLQSITIHLIVDAQETIELHGETEYTIGRADQLDGWQPAVDLTSYGGEPGGVSRRHARIFIEDGQPYLEDMGSLNGTYINTVRLITRVPQPLRDGDQLCFGRLAVQLRLKSPITKLGGSG
jgi:pSer/pThr/pTyr-binding forkhead associated (FHA) protein/ribosomal protein L40E